MKTLDSVRGSLEGHLHPFPVARFVCGVLVLLWAFCPPTIAGWGRYSQWKYHRRVKVREASGQPVTGFPYCLHLDTATLVADGRLKPDGSDLRLTDRDGEVPFQLEAMNSADTRVWFLVTLRAGEKPDDYVLHFGNPGASWPVDHGRADWVTVSLDTHTVENSVLLYQYGGQKLDTYQTAASINKFVLKEVKEDELNKVGTFAGMIDSELWADTLRGFSISAQGPVFVDIAVAYAKKTGEVVCTKRDRIYRDLPILEIQYDHCTTLNFEDRAVPGQTVDNQVFYLHGSNVTKEQWKYYSETKRLEHEEPYLKDEVEATGQRWDDCKFEGYYIYGYYNKGNGRVVGLVLPVNTAERELKVWYDDHFHLGSISVEVFPFWHGDTKVWSRHPYARWIFAGTQGARSIEFTGRVVARYARLWQDTALDGLRPAP